MMPLPDRIDQQLATTTDLSARGELLAEKACYLARTGEFAHARQIALELRQHFGDGRNARVSVWTMLLDGILLYYESVSSSARDRVFRANAIAAAYGIEDLRRLTGVWLAHLEFERSNYSLMTAALLEALVDAKSEQHAVWIRGALVIADAFQYIGDRQCAQLWYECARRHSTSVGDRAATGALMYNRAAFGIAFVHVAQHMSDEGSSKLCLTFEDMELDSAFHFQTGTNVTALVHTLTLSKARAAVCRGQFGSALNLLKSIGSLPVGLDQRTNRSSFQAELAWCLFKLDRGEELAELVQGVNWEHLDELDVDDKVVALSIFSRIAVVGARVANEVCSAAALEGARASYARELATVSAALASLRELEPL